LVQFIGRRHLLTLVQSNFQCQGVLNENITGLNANHYLVCLFQNNFVPTPANVLADFTEATFAGYARLSTASAFGVSAKVIDGEYQSNSSLFTFTASGSTPQTVYGTFIADPTFTNVLYSEAFPTGYVMVNSGLPLVLQYQLREYSAVILGG
jgi:hypothetical protein